MLGVALLVGAVAFINGLFALLLLLDVDGGPRRKLWEINSLLGTAIVTLTLGGVLVYQATASLGQTGSTALGFRRTAPPIVAVLVAAFPVLVILGQVEVNHPARLPFLFPLTNVGIVTIPSFVAATVVTQRYLRFNPIAWPVSHREWSTGIIYGAVGATMVASVINTLYLVLGGALLIRLYGEGGSFSILDNLPTLPRGIGIAFDLSVLSVVAPLNEEFWKGMLVGFFFFRKGGAARCFLWGVLAGAGFNILETFQNSLGILDPAALSQQQISGQWWLFAVARAGTGAIHASATGLSALGIYGLLRRRPRFLLGYPAGVSIHGSWNFLNYTLNGDAFLSQAGPDSRLLDISSVAGLAALFIGCVVLLWTLPARLRDEQPAPIYRLLGMIPERATWR